MEYQRSHRVGEMIQQEVSRLLIKGLKDPRIGFVTITAVDVSHDLHYARIFFTAMGDEPARTNSQRGLTSAIPFFRRELAKVLRLRLVPELTFQYDTSLDYGNRIESILRDINSGDHGPGNSEDHS